MKRSVQPRTRGEGRLLLRGTTWWLCYYGPDPERPGRRKEYRESSGTSDVKLAGAMLREKVAGIAADRFVAPAAERERFNAAADLYIAERQRAGMWSHPKPVLTHLKHLRAAFGHSRVGDITTEAVAAWVDDSLTRYKPGTVDVELKTLRAILRVALRHRLLVTLPHFPTLSYDNARRGFLEGEAFEAIRARIGAPVVADLAEAGHLTGWRIGELLALDWAWLDLPAREIHLPAGHSKNRTARKLPIGAGLAEVFARRWESRVDGGRIMPYVFHLRGQRLAYKVANRAWSRAAVAAGYFEEVPDAQRPGKLRKVPTLLFHDLRRTMARDLIRAKVSEQVAMTITGHKTREVFRRYNITALADQTAALAALDAYRTPAASADAHGQFADNITSIRGHQRRERRKVS